jgi:conjugal transfer pilus assembly protein TraW
MVWRFSLRLCSAALLACCLPLAAQARNLGVIGPTYAIAEPNLLQVILQRLQAAQGSGELDRLNQQAQQRLRSQVENPPPVTQVTATRQARSFHFDPTLQVTEPIRDADGRVLVPAGTAVNPLDVVSLSRPLLFLDARDSSQLDRARQLMDAREGHIKLILTGGSYLELMRRWQRPVFYDQQGLLVQRLGIRQVPALVTQDGRRLRIDELL